MSSTIAWWAGQSVKGIVLMLLLCPLGMMSNAWGQTLKTVTPAFIDHGRVRMGVVVEDTLRLYNAGPAPVVIEKIKTTCGCMAADFKTLSVAPGDTARIPYFFNTQGYAGVVRKSITLTLKKGNPKRLFYQFQVFVVRALEAEPRYLYLPDMPFVADSLYIREVSICNYSDAPVSIDSVYTDAAELTVDPVSFPLAPAACRQIRVLYRPRRRDMAQWTITLKSNHKSQPVLFIPFYVTFNEE